MKSFDSSYIEFLMETQSRAKLIETKFPFVHILYAFIFFSLTLSLDYERLFPIVSLTFFKAVCNAVSSLINVRENKMAFFSSD